MLGFDVGRIYVQKFFSPQQRAAVEDLVARIEQVFGAGVACDARARARARVCVCVCVWCVTCDSGLPSWLSAAGRAAALSKLAKVTNP